ncbi:uncharacterized protein [Musca autumnalis]|uniref:uncharacterized protein n=1 Tax=Musca autumnalis TaxID=221902 RepID=UPI003CF4B114
MLTRQASKQQANMENQASGSTVSAAINAPVTTGTSGFLTNLPVTTTASSVALSVDSDVSLSPNNLQNTIMSPDFASLTAQNIREESRRENLNLREDPNPVDSLQQMIASVSLAQEQLRKSIEVVRQLSQAQQRNELEPIQNQTMASGSQQPPTSLGNAGNQGRPKPPPLIPYPQLQQGTFSAPEQPSTSAGVRGAAAQPPVSDNAPRSNSHTNVKNRPTRYEHPPTPTYSNYSHSAPRFNLKKWGVKFDGSERTVDAEDFMFRVESMRYDYDFPYEELIKDFPQLLEGIALDWYWQQRRIAPFQSWEDLKAAFLSQFRRFDNEFQIQKRIMDRRQLPQETFEDFFNAVVKLRNQQRYPYSERDLVEIMKGNLKSSLAALIFPIKLEGLNHFRQEVRKAEAMIASQRQAHQQRTYQQLKVHEIDFGQEEVKEGFELDAIGARSKYTCWNCKKAGHSYVECSVPIGRVFCFKCGREGVVTPKCPRCQGNSPRNVSRAAETRSTQTETPQQ